jgi:ketosteroid isomerase-like protein
MSATSVSYLEDFSAAFNNHDVDTLMSMMTEDCIFEGAAGPEIYGIRFTGIQAVGEAFSEVWATYPDATWSEGKYFVSGDFAFSEWVFTGTNAQGQRIETQGCDIFILRDGKIHSKRAFRKNRPLFDV